MAVLDVASVTDRLAQFGLTVSEDDAKAISWCIERAEEYICTECNTGSVPEGLVHVAIDHAAGDFLRQKKMWNPDYFSSAGFSFDAAISAVSEGDISVQMGGESDSDKLDAFISALMDYGKPQFSAYRKLRW